ncbi:MAG: ABC transporter ATP-binding protein [Candidatus Altiarchaeota archaeon]
MSKSTIVKIKDISKTYGDKIKTKALRGINLEIRKGEFIAIVGPSGHGKSTLLHLIGGLDRATNGSIIIDNVDLSELGENELTDFRCKKIGFVFQFFNLIPTLTARENIEVPMMFLGFPENEQEKRAMELLKLMGLEDKKDAKPSELNGGQQQRVAIARALANDPEIILMDEPTGNLDSESRHELLIYIKKLNDNGKTIVIVTHDIEVANHAHKIYYIKDGKITNQQV